MSIVGTQKPLTWQELPAYKLVIQTEGELYMRNSNAASNEPGLVAALRHRGHYVGWELPKA